MSVETNVEETTNADGNSVSQPIAKPLVVSRFSSAENKERHKKILQVMSGKSCLELKEPYSEPFADLSPKQGYKYAINDYELAIEEMIKDFKNHLLYKMSLFFTNENLEKKIFIKLHSDIDFVPGQ